MEQYAPVALAVLLTLVLLAVGAAGRAAYFHVRQRRKARREARIGAGTAYGTKRRRLPLRVAASILLMGSAAAAFLAMRSIGEEADGAPMPEPRAALSASSEEGEDSDSDRSRKKGGDRRKRTQSSPKPPPAPDSFSVAVMNAAGIAGLAQGTASELESSGYKVGPVVDAPGPRDESVVMHDAEARREARGVGRELDIRELEVVTGEVEAALAGTDVVVVLGGDRAEDAGL